jgi:hypothetical protein
LVGGTPAAVHMGDGFAVLVSAAHANLRQDGDRVSSALEIGAQAGWRERERERIPAYSALQ